MGAIAVGFLLVVGCGMSDYEAKMTSEAKRVERYDRDEKMLGTPVEMPKDENDKAAKWNIFLRLPRPLPATPGTSSQPDMLTYSNPQGGLFFYALLGVFPDQKLEPILERFKKPTFDSYSAETADTSLKSMGRYYTDDGTHYLWIYPFQYSGGILVVVFAPDGNKRKEADDAVRASLATLAFGTGATRAKLYYGPFKKK
jgi:hypothetical protein